MNSNYIYITSKLINTFFIRYQKLKTLKLLMRAYLLKLLLNLQMVMNEPWKASAPEVYPLRTTDGSVPRGLDPNKYIRTSYKAHAARATSCIAYVL